MKKLAPQTNKPCDEYETPEYALKPLLPYLHKDWIVYECAWGEGSLARHLKKEGFKVIGNGRDFIGDTVIDINEFDVIVTNPPYSKKYEFLERCYEYDKPFALLMPLSTLEGKKRGELFSRFGIQLIIPNKRINFIKEGCESGAWFQTAWFTWQLNLPKDLLFIEF